MAQPALEIETGIYPVFRTRRLLEIGQGEKNLKVEMRRNNITRTKKTLRTSQAHLRASRF
jgi:hypothetical protein